MELNINSVCNSFRNGDHTTILIHTANGKVIEIQHRFASIALAELGKLSMDNICVLVAFPDFTRDE